MSDREEEYRSVLFGRAHAACDLHVVDALNTVAGAVVRVRKLDPPGPSHRCACELSADWFLMEVEPSVAEGSENRGHATRRIVEERERARNLAVALEDDSARLTDLLRLACAYLTSEGAYDMTSLLEEVQEAGIPAYDGLCTDPDCNAKVHARATAGCVDEEVPA